MEKLIIYTDGGARGNPGEAGIGVVIYDENGNIIKEISRYIGEQTNNVAEYYALIRGLEEAMSMDAKNVSFYLDSELVVKQINGEYKVKNEGLKPLYGIAKAYLQQFEEYAVSHVRRENNKIADKLVNHGIDNK